MLKNEFGDVAVDSKLASASAISGVQELLNGCICCNLVGQVSDALETLRNDVSPDRIIIETSGSAFPATLAMEINRVITETGHYLLDGIISVIDVENWNGYEDTSYTAKVQAQYTDLIVMNKWELVDERRLEDVEDRILDLAVDPPTPRTKSKRGWVGSNLVFGLDAALSKGIPPQHDLETLGHKIHNHQSEVEVLDIRLSVPTGQKVVGLDTKRMRNLLTLATKDEIYRIKAVLYCSDPNESALEDELLERRNAKRMRPAEPSKYILNWAFGRWTYTALDIGSTETTPLGSGTSTPLSREGDEPILRMTIVTARHEGNKWQRRIQGGDYLIPEDGSSAVLTVQRTA